MPYTIIRENIVKLKVDAIVNAANRHLEHGAGVCGAIFSAAGAAEMKKACDEIGFCETGEAVITKGFNLPAKHVIHAVGPIYIDGKHNEEKLLFNAYTNSLLCAKNNNLKSIAFPLISAGTYGYPRDKALSIASQAISEFLLENDMDVILTVYDKSSYLISKKLFSNIETFIDENFEYKREDDLSSKRSILKIHKLKELSEPTLANHSSAIFSKPKRSLENLVVGETFAEMLLRLIDEKNKTDAEVYKKANIDRKLFSKIRSNKDYMPKKKTIIAFAISLELSLDETKDLLEKAGYALSRSQKFDLIIEFFIAEKNYNIFEINEALFAFDQQLLGM